MRFGGGQGTNSYLRGRKVIFIQIDQVRYGEIQVRMAYRIMCTAQRLRPAETGPGGTIIKMVLTYQLHKNQ